MLDPATWLHKAQALAEGQRQRATHDCGDGMVLTVDHKANGWGAWCHRCHEPGWVFKPTPTIAERAAKLRATKQADESIERTVRPPKPANFDPSTWPLPARVWVYKAGIGNDLIKELGFYYHEPTKRVVMPVLDGDKLLYWQARGFDPDHAKYLNPSVPDKPAYKRGAGPVLVLTEDILSAVRVGGVTEAWCLMGTSITDLMLSAILAADKPVRVWLDPDGAGVKGRRKFVPKLRAYGIDASAIRSDKDPKYYSKEEIANQLGLNPTSAS